MEAVELGVAAVRLGIDLGCSGIALTPRDLGLAPCFGKDLGALAIRFGPELLGVFLTFCAQLPDACGRTPIR
jgi:hypothetical protein